MPLKNVPYLSDATNLDRRLLLCVAVSFAFRSMSATQVASKLALDDDIVAILSQISSLGFLVQCSSINP